MMNVEKVKIFEGLSLLAKGTLCWRGNEERGCISKSPCR